MKISVVMTYFERQAQLEKTLLSIAKTAHKDFEVIIVDDCSKNDIILPELPYKAEVIKLKDKTWFNTANVYNVGFHRALKSNPDVVIIQNAECYHHGDVLSYAEKVTDDNYIAFACYSLAKDEEPGTVINDRIVTFTGDSGWYNHPVHRPVAFHFCAAITAKNLRKINGFDERFCEGVAYEDNYFVHQIRNLGLRIDIPTDPMVFHQFHYVGAAVDPERVKRNEGLWRELESDNNYRAVHKLTPGL